MGSKDFISTYMALSNDGKNNLKLLCHIEIDDVYMCIKFGGRGISSFAHFASFQK